MNVILVPGFWWDASLWRDIEPALRDAGHAVRSLTLPGLRDGDDPAAVREVVSARKGPLFDSVDPGGAVTILGWPRKTFDRIAGERNLATDRFGRYALADIHALAGKPFNINSPQQLGKVLFEDLHLAAPGRPKGKQASTAADVLESLAAEHEIARKVLEYRQFAKLKGTYVDALPSLADANGRIHTTFHQTGAATGRLSSSGPNLQNIPIRTELGREIRAAFVPERGWKLIAADYSQIELRLLAHMSGDPVLQEAFRNGEDIHARTAAEVFGIMPGLVTPDMRRSAKAVNFGIVYGQTAFGLGVMDLPPNIGRAVRIAAAGVDQPHGLSLRAAGAGGDAHRHRLPDLLHDRPVLLQNAARPAAQGQGLCRL